jgi:hypothetical protein
MADRRPVRVALASFGVVPAVLAVLSLVEAIRA